MWALYYPSYSGVLNKDLFPLYATKLKVSHKFNQKNELRKFKSIDIYFDSALS